MMSLWKHLGRPGRSRFIAALTLSAVSGACGVLLLGLSGWFLTASALAGMAGAGFIFNHLYPSAGVRLFAFSRVLSRYGDQLAGHDATLRLSAQLRPALFAAGARSARGFAAMPAKALSHLLDDVEAAEGGFLRVISPAAMVAAAIAVSLGLALAADLLTACLALAGFAVSAWWLPRRAVRRAALAAECHAETAAAGREDVARLVENAVELDIIGALDRHCETARTSLETQQALLDRLERPFRGLGALNTLFGLSLAMFCLLRAAHAGVDLALAACASLALLAAFEACSAMIKVLDAAPRSAASSARLLERLRALPAASEPPLETAAPLDLVFPVVCKGLTFAAAENAPVIGPVNLTIARQSVVEVVGASGSGKTTFAETLMRMHPVRAGEIWFGALTIGQVRSASVFERLAISPQFPTFLHGTVRDQFRLARPSAEDDQILEALALAEARALVMQSPAGLGTMLDEGEGGFSGGELRRIGLARAVLANPQLLILDEPFAGLEPVLAETIAGRLAGWALQGDRSLLLLQHKPSSFAWRGLQHSVIQLR
ncbi:MAG: ATP-binding cassette domain-containing protein [Hyphomonas sp.]|uniref:ATP-binding cassette domain-containing protein n=1 Tax=Hyphomonas sp. TaxID=87 RepID=UPI0018447E28|nr:ATP-binding cassette domain-containing protein [Hyphomonas sp.]MBU3919750.1 ATP-binding cassette domain-containing protein [Alphaproteobacteria bacterium]MBA3067768.1 ATP-binding cassette domain-containing protein [Hyphomonas sp.]MBU4062144.1 ATP-binding cassette domain-containing protein [Alphaproteobacteria bacterium]MBU4165579.1 ATP-binding cassette domain-containing protein [Alphaproteobacteria bacterium]MBU4569481.1 ATP-binding cassette domain-containing protein [Alphaproteobacteria ba